MSKTDAIRAMKLARLESQRASAPAAPAPKTAARPAAPKPTAATAADTAAPDAAGSGDLVPEALCGHTAISGRRCTRPQGHAEKNHRYAA